MSQQLELTAPFVVTSATSHAAAKQIEPRLNELQQRVLEFVKAHPSVTDEAIALALGLNPSTARPRRIELEKMNLIEEAGRGKTRSGRAACLWRVTNEGGR